MSQQKQPSTPAAAQGGGGGFLSNMMSTAGGVALGHTIGHAITGGGSGKNVPSIDYAPRNCSTWRYLFNSRTAKAGAIIGLLLVFYNSKNLNCIGALSFLRLEEDYWRSPFF